MDRCAQMFITADEFERLIDQAISDLDLEPRFDPGSPPFDFIYVVEKSRPTDESIRLQRPLAEGRTLYLVQHDLRTTNAALVGLFDRLRRRWNRFLARPVRGTNIAYGGSGSY